MHLLCDALNRSGQEAYITASVLNPELMTCRLTEDVAALHRSQGLEPIVVYPEIFDDNPLQGTTVVRYLLNQPGFIEGKGSYGSDDIFFSITRALLQPGMAEDRVLYLPPIDLRVFCPPKDPAKRIPGKVCYYQGRRGHAKIDPELLPPGAIEITPSWPESWEAMADLFQECEYFYCGETSGLAGEAALCGCLSIICPSEWASLKIGLHENKSHGVAWGGTPEEIERARITQPLLRESLLQHQRDFWPALDNFIEVTQAAANESLNRRKNIKTSNWLASRQPSAIQNELIKTRLQSQREPKLCLLINGGETNPFLLDKTLASLDPSASWDVQVLSHKGSLANNINKVLSDKDFDWFLLLQAGEELTYSGQLTARLDLLKATDCHAISFDEMYRQENGFGVALRPAVNLDYLLSFPSGTSRHWLFRRNAVVNSGGFDESFNGALEFDLLLRLINKNGLGSLAHVAEPLVVTQIPSLSNVEDERLAIIRHLQARGYLNSDVTAPAPGRYKLCYGHAESASVSILLPAGGDLGRLQRCVEGVLEGTGNQNFEILLLESPNQGGDISDWLAALVSLGEAKLRVIRSSSPNTAHALNEAADLAIGDYLLFLSTDMAVIESGWLDALLNHANRGEVGAVGGKLLTPDGKIAQALQILGLQGPVGNPFVGKKLDTPGYMQRLQVSQNVSALSLDGMMVPRDLYLQLDGLREAVPHAYLATDFSLRVREAGYLLVWSPDALLMLDRQDSAPPSSAEQDEMYARWLPQLARDPAYNPNFSLVQPGGFQLADSQISWRPLESWRPLPVVLAHPADTMGCGHYRVMQPLNALREAGLVDGLLSVGLMHVVDLERYNPDSIVLQRQIGDERLEAMRRIKAFSRAFKVYELDDYLPNLPMKSVHKQLMPKDVVKSLRQGLSYVDRFVVSTDVMAELFASYHPSVQVMKNRLDPRWWSGLALSARRGSSKPRVGWAGGSSHTGDLEMIFDVVKELAGEVEWVFFGMCPEKLKPYVHEFHAGVEIESYAAKLASMNLDLALAPVEQNVFNECKSNLRLLEYGACGFPVICSDVRCYQGDGLPVMRVKNRFRDWVDAIRMHIGDLDAAARAGDELRAVVQRDWMLEGANLAAWKRAWLPD